MNVLTEEVIASFKDAARKLTGAKRRAFQAQVTLDYLDGSVWKAERVFGWSHHTVALGLNVSITSCVPVSSSSLFLAHAWCVSILVLWGSSCVPFYRSGRESCYPGSESRRKTLLPSCVSSLLSRTNWRAPGNFWRPCRVGRHVRRRASVFCAMKRDSIPGVNIAPNAASRCYRGGETGLSAQVGRTLHITPNTLP